MRHEQKIINQINNKIDFTFPHKSQTKRYIVGKRLLHESHNPSLLYDDIYKDVYNFVKSFNDCKNIFTINKSNIKYKYKTIGGWFNKDKGTYCVDIGKSFNDLDKAIDFGIKHNQICIYDTLEDKTISVLDYTFKPFNNI